VVVLVDRARSGFEDEGRDAGVSDAEDDAGDELPDAGTSEVQDAGSAPQPVEAGWNDDVDAGAARADAGTSEAPDAGSNVAIDASTGALDAADPAPNTPEAGTAQDAGYSGNYPDAETPDGSTQIDSGSETEPAPDAGDPAGEPDASTRVDSGVTPVDSGDSDAFCEPLACSIEQCGSVPNGCGGEMPCGNCEEHGGVCGLYEAGVCGDPIGQL
jgi:hypothetical protein